MSKIKNGGLDQYGAGPFEQQQFGTAGVKVVKETNAKAVISSEVSSTEAVSARTLCHN